MNAKKLSLLVSLSIATIALTTATTASATLLDARASTTVTAKLDTAARTRADAEISARLKALTNLKSRISQMAKLSAENKASLTATVQASIDSMTALKAKIDVDTDNATLKADIQSITKSYRVYVLIMPQVQITAAADRAMDIADKFTILNGQLQAKITAAQNAGKNVTALNTSLADMNAKIADANIQAKAAIDLVATLKPDNGDRAVYASNQTALKSARTKIRAANADLVTARKDAGNIVKGLASFGISASASSTTQSTTTIQ